MRQRGRLFLTTRFSDRLGGGVMAKSGWRGTPPTLLKELSDRDAFQELNEVVLKACAEDAPQRYKQKGIWFDGGVHTGFAATYGFSRQRQLSPLTAASCDSPARIAYGPRH